MTSKRGVRSSQSTAVRSIRKLNAKSGSSRRARVPRVRSAFQSHRLLAAGGRYWLDSEPKRSFSFSISIANEFTRASVPVSAPRCRRRPDRQRESLRRREPRQTVDSETPQFDRPRVKENYLDVEDQKQNCGEIETDRKTTPRAAAGGLPHSKASP